MIQLSEHFNYKKLIRFTMPSIIMLVVTSVYGVVDGFFVSNFAGKTSFAAVNFIMPFLMIMGCVGFMFGTGGGALIAKTIGEGDREKAKQLFSMIVFASALCGVLLAITGLLIIEPVAKLLGAEDRLLSDSLRYGRIILIAIPFYVLQFEFQCLFATAQKPKLGLFVTVAAGCTNVVLDALFVAVFKMGLTGAAVATALSQFVGGLIPLIYFCCKNSSLLRFTKFGFNGKALCKTVTNGSSELMSNISMSIVGMLYNFQLLKYAGENGVAAYGVLMYVNLVFQAVFLGFSVGIAPVISFNMGANNFEELKNLRKKCLMMIGVFSVAMFVLAETLAKPLSYVFVGYDGELTDLTVRAFYIYSCCFLFSGFSIFGSSFFTALNDGLVSALIAFLRTLVFQVIAVLCLPLLFKLDGIWISIVVAEIMSIFVTLFFFITKRKKYNY